MKAHYRRAQARLARGAVAEAAADARRALSLPGGCSEETEELLAAAEAAAARAPASAAPATAPPAEEALDGCVAQWEEDVLWDVAGQLMAAPTPAGVDAVVTHVRLLHPDTGGGAASHGRVDLSGAFESTVSLADAAGFVRGQHRAASAAAAALVVPRAAVRYPLVWYAGSWPDHLATDEAGVFVELHTPHGGRRTWFIAAATPRAPATRLPDDCALLLGERYALLP